MERYKGFEMMKGRGGYFGRRETTGALAITPVCETEELVRRIIDDAVAWEKELGDAKV